MEDLAFLMKKFYFSGYKQAQEDANVSIQDQTSPDAPEINILRRGWPDPLKRAKKLHEASEKKNFEGGDVKERTKMTKDSPEVTVG